MKKILSLMGAASLAASGVGSTISMTNMPTQQQNIYKIENQSSQAQPMLEMPQIKLNFLPQAELNSFAVGPQAAEGDFDWTQLNDFLDLGFNDSNDYTPWLQAYGPSAWWKVWEWGADLYVPEGDINVFRVVKAFMGTYNNVNFEPLEKILVEMNRLVAYASNIQDKLEDKVEVIHDLIVKLVDSLKTSGIPLNEDFVGMLTSTTNILRFLKNQKLEMVYGLISSKLEDGLGMNLEELAKEWKSTFETITSSVRIVNSVLSLIQNTLPADVVNFILGSFKDFIENAIACDLYGKGIVYRLQQFVYPIEIYAIR